MTDEQNTGGAPESGASSTPAKESPRAPARSSLEEFSELLRGLDPKGGDSERAEGGDESPDENAGEPARKPKKPKTFDELAQAIGVKVASLYDIEVPSSRAGEKPLKLGELKDLMKERDDFQVASLKLDEDRRTLERDKVNAETELREMLAQLPADALKPEAVKKLRDGIEKKRAVARAQILEAFPEWNDPTNRESDLRLITEHLKGYGIRESFVLANLEPNVLRLLRDSQRLAERVNKALAMIEERRPNVAPSARKRGNAKADTRQAPAGRVESEVTAFRNQFSDRAKH